MINRTLNLGILAHVDAGKTSLTERLLYQHGVIRRLGSVDEGNTTTDSGDLERERGITIRSAVASFNIEDLRVNLIDTPGHPDFIAEVERALSVLDGVVLVISAVEGVQAQTKVLMRSLQKMAMPTLIFVNKVDRMGARTDELLKDIERSLALRLLPITSVAEVGSQRAVLDFDAASQRMFRMREREEIIVNDDRLLAATLNGRDVVYEDLVRSLASQTHAGTMNPVFFGSALMGVGTDALSQGIRLFLPSTPHQQDDPRPAKGIVFAIEREFANEKVACIRLFEGSLKERQTISYTQREANGQIREHEESVSAIKLVAFEPATPPAKRKDQVNEAPAVVYAGDIAKVRGLSAVRVGAFVGDVNGSRLNRHFRPPTLESVVHCRSELDRTKLYSALMAMSDEDPLIQATVTEDGGLSIKLYGEVQKEVISDRLYREYRIEPVFSETKAVYFERPTGIGEAELEYDTIHVHDNVFPITIGLRVEPNTLGAGNQFVREAKWGLMPGGFYRVIEDSAMKTLSQGLYGWEVTDCVVYLTKVGYERPLAVAAHFRSLAAILVMRALKEAGSQVFEPCNKFELEVPGDSHGVVIGHLVSEGAEIERTQQAGEAAWLIIGNMPTRIVQDFTRDLPRLTNGEGVLVSFPGADRPMPGKLPVRQRTDGNPLDYENYLKYLAKNKLL